MIKFDKTIWDMAVIPKSVIRSLLTVGEASIKVYLYGLLREEGEPERIQQETGIDKTAFWEAVDELQKRGLLFLDASLGDTRMVFQNKESAVLREAEESLYKDASFNNMLQALFSDRELSYTDYKVFYELVDVYGMPRPVVLVLAEYCIGKSRTGNRVSMRYIRETAKTWAKEGIDTLELAQQKISAIHAAPGGAQDILRSLKINRLPTEQEEVLYEKWKEEWGFSHEAIHAATAATTGAQYPTFKYLDGILKNLYGAKRLSSVAVKEYFSATGQMDDTIKMLLRKLSYPRLTVSSEHRMKYLRWQEMGFGEKEMDFACACAVSAGTPSLEYMDTLLTGWKSQGLVGEADIQAYLEQQAAKKETIKKMLETAGVKKRISRGDERSYEKFSGKYGFPDAIILYAAACAYGLSAPLKAMDTILSRWKETGVHTLEEAKRQDEDFRKSHAARKRMSDIAERTYSEQELDALVKDPIANYQNIKETADKEHNI